MAATVNVTPPLSGDPERVPLSQNQEFLCMFETGGDHSPFGPAYAIVNGWRVRGPVRTGPLAEALEDLVRRHGALRTTVVRGEERYQHIAPPAAPELIVRDCPGVAPADRGRRAEELLIELESGAWAVTEPPLLRAVLARFDDEDSVLALISHHAAVDQWSMNVLIRELASRYAARTGHAVPELPDVPQFTEYAIWERAQEGSVQRRRSYDYWAAKLAGGMIAAGRTDHPRSPGLPKSTAAYRFRIDADVIADALALAKDTRSTPFMVLFGVYNAFLRETAGVVDATVPTLTPGRGQARFETTVGAFYNFVPLRTDMTGATTLREIIARTRKTCLEAYTHELSFGQIVGAAGPQIMADMVADGNTVFAFQVLRLPYVLSGEPVGDLTYTAIRRELSQEVTTDLPDGALWELDMDPAGDGATGCLWFDSNRFTEASIRDLVAGYLRVLRRSVASPDAQLPPVPAERAA